MISARERDEVDRSGGFVRRSSQVIALHRNLILLRFSLGFIMKLFGWGKSKDSPPQARQQLSKPGCSCYFRCWPSIMLNLLGALQNPKSGSHGLDRGSSGMRSVMPSKGSSTSVRKQRGLFESESEEKSQDNIQFVFSHEQEGLLAIGTFALEQLQSIRDTIDGHRRGADPGGHKFRFDSGVNLLALDNDVMQSSDDEDQLQRSWLAARKTCDLPVFGDEFEVRGESDLEQAPFSHLECLATQNRTGVQQPWRKESKALILYKANPNLNPVVDDTPVFRLAPELRSSLHRLFLPHWTNSVPPPVIAKVEEGPFVVEAYNSTRLCDLFSKKKSLKSDRASKSGLKYNLMAIVPADGEDGKRIVPIEQTKRAVLTFAEGSMPSLGKLAKLWRASCTPLGSARIAPHRKPSPLVGSKVPPCGSKVSEVRKKLRKHERMMDNLGDPEHWIEDDEDCEFATFLFNTSQ